MIEPEGDEDNEPDDYEDCSEDHFCPACNGTGTSWDGLGECRECDGDGYID